MIKIPVEPLKQATSDDCSITCLRMLLGYYGVRVSRNEIFEFILKATPEGGSFLSEMARFARKEGFAVDLFAYNLYLTDPIDNNLPTNQLLEKLQKELEDSKRDKYYDLMLESTINGIKEGIKYIIKKPNTEIIRAYLNRETPLSIRLNYAALVNKQGDPFNSHDVVLCGLKVKEIYMIDPENASGRWFNIGDLMFAVFQSKIISASAYLLAVKPK